eukprot:2359548-Prymnesium_polylepis.1
MGAHVIENVKLAQPPPPRAGPNRNASRMVVAQQRFMYVKVVAQMLGEVKAGVEVTVLPACLPALPTVLHRCAQDAESPPGTTDR